MLEAIKKRRSIRFYNQEIIPDEKIKEIIDAGFHAPSGHANRNWHVIAVKDKSVIGKLSDIHRYTKFMKKAPLMIVVCVAPSDTDIFWIEDGSAFMQNMLIQATEFGIGSCWVGIRGIVQDEKDADAEVRKICNIPSDIHILGIASFGYPARLPSNEWDMSIIPDRIHIDGW